MEIKVKARPPLMDVIVTDGSTVISYDPTVMGKNRYEREIEPGFAEMMLDAAVEVVEFSTVDTDTSDAIRRLFERLPGIKKDQLLSELVAEHTDLNESIEALQARITELEEKLDRIGMMEAERDTLQEMSDAASVKIFELEEKIEALEARIAGYKFGEEE